MATAISPTNIPATPTGCGWNICWCCYLWVLFLPFDLPYATLFLRSSTVKKMTELKSRGVKMLPSKDNQHKISVCECQPQILHGPANKYLEKCNMQWVDKGKLKNQYFPVRIPLLLEDVRTSAQMSCDRNANTCRLSYIRKQILPSAAHN